jgi:hypothetical protein
MKDGGVLFDMLRFCQSNVSTKTPTRFKFKEHLNFGRF